MKRSVSSDQKKSEIETVRLTLTNAEWLRPSEIAQRTGLSTAVVLAALKALTWSNDVTRREYTIKRQYTGKTRSFAATRLIVEYRLSRFRFPDFLQPAVPVFENAKARIIRFT